jgi:hypothetical protein
MPRKRETQRPVPRAAAGPLKPKDGTKLNVHFVTQLGTNPALQRNVSGTGNRDWQPETRKVVGKQYLTQQAVTLLKFAQTVTDPNVAAGLVEKAVDLKSRVDASNGDKSPRAPDVVGNSDSR